MVICVTNSALCKEDFLTRITSICKAGPKFVILREKALNKSDYYNLAKQCRDICNSHGVKLVLHTHIDTALALEVTAIHLPLSIFRLHPQSLKNFTTVGTSVHSVKEAILAEQLGATYLIAGHIFPTQCKAGMTPRGIPFLKDILEISHIPVYPIGGIHTDNVQTIVETGAQDFCIMSELMTCKQAEKQIKIYNQIKRANIQTKKI